jgi:glycosyltransferase involved in cell wall biosynthesis
MADSRRPGASAPQRFHPVPIVAVDLDAPATDLAVDPASSRAWIEASRRGHVVGMAEVTPKDGVIGRSELAALAASHPDDGPRPVDVVDDDVLPYATVVVPTICRHPELLVRTVQSLVELDYPRFEVLIVDNRGPGAVALPELPAGRNRVRVLAEPKRGVSRARNAGLAAATGEIVAFTDDDAEVDPRWLRAFGARFSVDPDVDALGGLVQPRELLTEPQLWFEEFYGGFSQYFTAESWSTELVGSDDVLFPYAAGRFGAGCNMAFRRAALLRLGGFDVRLGAGTPARGGEDLSVFVNFVTSGATAGFEPSALVRHSHRRTEREFFRQVLDYGIGLTAMYAALVAEDRHHLVEMLRRVPAGIGLLVRPREERSVSVRPSYPRRTILVQMLGMLLGPMAYVRSRRWVSAQS